MGYDLVKCCVENCNNPVTLKERRGDAKYYRNVCNYHHSHRDQLRKVYHWDSEDWIVIDVDTFPLIGITAT